MFWHLDMKLRISHFLAADCVAHDVWFSGIYLYSWWCLSFWRLDVYQYLMMSDSLASTYVADDVWSFFGTGYVTIPHDVWFSGSESLTSRYVAYDVWFSGKVYVAVPDNVCFSECSICTSWYLTFWLLDMLQMMYDFLASCVNCLMFNNSHSNTMHTSNNTFNHNYICCHGAKEERQRTVGSTVISAANSTRNLQKSAYCHWNKRFLKTHLGRRPKK